jgi:two-component system chemotaxis response regulator CheY
MFDRFRFLIVDDNSTVRLILKEILRGLGARTTEMAADGGIALQMLKAQPFDILITDMTMPGVSGVELTRAVRLGAARARREMPIIMLSANLDRGVLTAARDAGVSEFVAKPVVIASLKARLEASILRPRSFIISEGYNGPCRRRIASGAPASGDRRRTPAATFGSVRGN